MKIFDSLRNKISNFSRDEEGASAIEYAILAGIIVLAVAAFGGGLTTAFQGASDTISAAINPAADPG